MIPTSFSCLPLQVSQLWTQPSHKIFNTQLDRNEVPPKSSIFNSDQFGVQFLFWAIAICLIIVPWTSSIHWSLRWLSHCFEQMLWSQHWSTASMGWSFGWWWHQVSYNTSYGWPKPFQLHVHLAVLEMFSWPSWWLHWRCHQFWWFVPWFHSKKHQILKEKSGIEETTCPVTICF